MSDQEDRTDDQKLVPKEAAWKELLVNRKAGMKEPTSLANVIVTLCHSPKWKGVFVHDVFADEILVRRCPAWENESRFRVHRLSHNDIVMTAAALEYEGLSPTVGKTQDAIKAAARERQVHPVREYFDSLVWDGDERHSTWLRTYLGARDQDPNYLDPIGAMWLAGGVKRIYEPGAKHDYMLVLEGPQGIGKSYSLQTLATFGREEPVSYFTDSVKFSDISTPAAIMALQGKLIVEFAELSGMNKRDMDDVKNWITIQRDVLQKKYENETTAYPRQFILAGTTNEDAWLRDPTGNRRFMPVRLRDKINIDWLRRDCEQLWAEAVFRYKEGMVIHVEHGSVLEHLSTVEQSRRLVDDVWTEPVLNYVRYIEQVSINEVLQAIPVAADRRDELASRRIARILRAAGWERGQKWVSGRNTKVWNNPDPKYAPVETGRLEMNET